MILILILSTSTAGWKAEKVQLFELGGPPALISTLSVGLVRIQFGLKQQSLSWHAIWRNNVSVIILWPLLCFWGLQIPHSEFTEYILNELTLCGRGNNTPPRSADKVAFLIRRMWRQKCFVKKKCHAGVLDCFLMHETSVIYWPSTPLALVKT